jgi:putative FmdB family regulatory protein
MPVYEFECQECGEVFDKFLKSYDEMKKTKFTCPKCQSKDTKNIISESSFFVMGYNSKNKYSKKQTQHR